MHPYGFRQIVVVMIDQTMVDAGRRLWIRI
jgi:hypothetical protein